MTWKKHFYEVKIDYFLIFLKTYFYYSFISQ